MEGFQNEEERMEILQKLFPDVLRKYPKTITQQQASEISCVGVRTIRKWERSGKLPFVPAIDKLLHYHQINLYDLLDYLYAKNCLHDPDGLYMVRLKTFYIEKYKSYPDALLTRDISNMTGYGKTSVIRWLNIGWLKGYTKRSVFRIPKQYLINFVCNPHYRQITRKSKVHKADMQSFLDDLQKSKEALLCQNTNLNSNKSWNIHDAGYTGNL